jgi:hypothetical protein
VELPMTIATRFPANAGWVPSHIDQIVKATAAARRIMRLKSDTPLI